jgi:MFS family permease
MPNRWYRSYVLGALTTVYALNFLDRGLMLLLLEPIKRDLHLSDTQLGFVTGIAFAAFYAVVGIPIARWADRGDRVSITSLAIGLWGLTVMACLNVFTFLQLVAVRIASAVGEAGCMPPTYSLLGDYFPGGGERARAMSIYWLASPLALFISLFIGAWLNSRYGWRMTFFAAGIPALVAAVVVRITVREPRSGTLPLATTSVPSARGVAAALWSQRSSRHLCIAISLFYFMALGITPWYAAFMIRIHDVGVSVVGFWFSIIFGGAGLVGMLFGGYVAGGVLAGRERLQMRLSAIAVGLLTPFITLFVTVPSASAALMILVPTMLLLNVIIGPTFAIMQRLVSDETRATATAIILLIANLVGMGLGPQAVGLASDLLSPRFHAYSLRYAIILISLVALAAAYNFWRVGDTVAADLVRISSSRSASPSAWQATVVASDHRAMSS